MDTARVDYTYLSKTVASLDKGDNGALNSVLARSILGREIPIITLGKGKKAVLYVGAHQGTDGLTAGILLDFVRDYLRQYEKMGMVFDYSMKYLFEQRRIYVVPMVNPDGVEYAEHGVTRDNPLYERLLQMNGGADFSRWQANARGVDLNHNYATGFVSYKEKELASGIINGAPVGYSGEHPESEPETAAIGRFLRVQQESVRGVLSLHTQGEQILCSCGDCLSAKTMSAGRLLARLCGYRLVHPDGVSAAGGLSDWCIESLGRPAYTVKCGRGEGGVPPEDRPKIYERLRRALFSFPFFV